MFVLPAAVEPRKQPALQLDIADKGDKGGAGPWNG